MLGETPVKPSCDVLELDLQISTLKAKNDQLEQKVKESNEAIAVLRQKLLATHVATESEEEAISNHLFRRLDGVLKEKAQLEGRLKVEEQNVEQLTQKIRNVKSQKVAIENQIEHEQESVMNDLHKKLLEMAAEKNRLELKLQAERSDFLHRLHERIGCIAEERSLKLPSRTSADHHPPAATASSDKDEHTKKSVLSESRQESRESFSSSICASSPEAAASTRPRRSPSISETNVLQLEEEVTALLQDQEAQKEKITARKVFFKELQEQFQMQQNLRQAEKYKAVRYRAELAKAKQELTNEKRRWDSRMSPGAAGSLGGSAGGGSGILLSRNSSDLGRDELGGSQPSLEDIRSRSLRVLQSPHCTESSASKRQQRTPSPTYT